MKTIFIVVAVFSAVLLASCGAPTERTEPGIVTVSGRIIGADENSPSDIRVNFMNPFSDHDDDIELSPLRSFRVEREMPWGQSMNVWYDRRFYTFYAEPGDHIQLTIDATARSVTFSGDRAELNREFTEAYDYANFSATEWFDDELSADDFLAAVTDRIASDRERLGVYAAERGFSVETVRLMEAEWMTNAIYAATWWREDRPESDVMRRLFNETTDIFSPRWRTSQMWANNLLMYVSRAMGGQQFEDPSDFLRDFLPAIASESAGLARDVTVYQSFAMIEQNFPGTVAEFLPEAAALMSSDYARAQLTKL